MPPEEQMSESQTTNEQSTTPEQGAPTGQPPAQEGQQQPSQSQPSQEQQTSGAQSQQFNLTDNVSDDFKSLVENKGWKSVDDMAKSYQNLESVMGNPLVAPSADATQEDWNKFYERLGRPTDPSNYNMGIDDERAQNLTPEVKESLNQNIERFKNVAHKNGLTTQQAESVFSEIFDEDYQNEVSKIQEKQQAVEQEKYDLQKEWGPAYEERLDTAKRAAKVVGGEDFSEALDTLEGQVGYKKVVELMYNVGSKMSENGTALGLGETGESAQTTNQAQARLAQLNTDPVWLNPSKDPQKHAILKNEREKLYNQLYKD